MLANKNAARSVSRLLWRNSISAYSWFSAWYSMPQIQALYPPLPTFSPYLKGRAIQSLLPACSLELYFKASWWDCRIEETWKKQQHKQHITQHQTSGGLCQVGWICRSLEGMFCDVQSWQFWRNWSNSDHNASAPASRNPWVIFPGWSFCCHSSTFTHEWRQPTT